MLQKYLNKNKFNLGPFLPCKAALKHACEAQTWGFYWKLPWRGGWGCKAWEKRWNQGERKISACTWAANRHKSLAVFLLQGMTVCWNRKQQQLFAGSLNTNTKHSGIRNCLSAALLTCQGKNWGQYKADFTVSTCPEEEKKKKKAFPRLLVWLLAGLCSNTALSISILLTSCLQLPSPPGVEMLPVVPKLPWLTGAGSQQCSRTSPQLSIDSHFHLAKPKLQTYSNCSIFCLVSIVK